MTRHRHRDLITGAAVLCFAALFMFAATLREEGAKAGTVRVKPKGAVTQMHTGQRPSGYYQAAPGFYPTRSGYYTPTNGAYPSNAGIPIPMQPRPDGSAPGYYDGRNSALYTQPYGAHRSGLDGHQ